MKTNISVTPGNTFRKTLKHLIFLLLDTLVKKNPLQVRFPEFWQIVHNSSSIEHLSTAAYGISMNQTSNSTGQKPSFADVLQNTVS